MKMKKCTLKTEVSQQLVRKLPRQSFAKYRSALPFEDKLKYRELIGKPTTDVLLPSGDMFSAK